LIRYRRAFYFAQNNKKTVLIELGVERVVGLHSLFMYISEVES
jgi:hypothetical protein